MAYTGPEKRRHPRAKGNFIVSYRVLEEEDNIDVTQTKDIGLGGMYLTTNRQFNPGTRLAVEIRLPFDPYPIILTARVVESYEVSKDLIYDTRLQFLSVDERHKNVINKTVDFYIEKEETKDEPRTF